MSKTLIALFSILFAGTLFVNTSAFTDNQILPKWLFAFIGLGVIGLVFPYFLIPSRILFLGLLPY